MSGIIPRPPMPRARGPQIPGVCVRCLCRPQTLPQHLLPQAPRFL